MNKIFVYPTCRSNISTKWENQMCWPSTLLKSEFILSARNLFPLLHGFDREEGAPCIGALTSKQTDVGRTRCLLFVHQVKSIAWSLIVALVVRIEWIEMTNSNVNMNWCDWNIEGAALNCKKLLSRWYIFSQVPQLPVASGKGNLTNTFIAMSS